MGLHLESYPPHHRSRQTGPKGVLSDYKQYKELKQLKELEDEKELIRQAKKNTLTCRTHNEDVLAELKERALEDAIDNLHEDDEFLAQYRQNRMRELHRALERLPTYNKIFDLKAVNFVSEIDSASAGVTVLVHVYELSRSGVPAILVYKKGDLIGNLLGIDRDLGQEFYPVDLENYLIERGFLPDKTLGLLLNAQANAAQGACGE
ncbi:unnamed protein product [Echinostoma caproni]|uniref:Phosducin domain-containing protein n=1 Tax=Echinostoma caproni TaxID=27848 RepID=A0A183AI40_9TREM|nr:unnamed protein product [Echinostoma caproni]